MAVELKEPPAQKKEKQPRKPRSHRSMLMKSVKVLKLLQGKRTPPGLREAIELQVWALMTATVQERKESYPIVRDFLGGVGEINDFLQYFNSSPRRAVEGPRGVAEEMEISKTAVNKRIQHLGLKGGDFREPGATLQDLLRKSKVMTARLKRLKSLHKRHCP